MLVNVMLTPHQRAFRRTPCSRTSQALRRRRRRLSSRMEQGGHVRGVCCPSMGRGGSSQPCPMSDSQEPQNRERTQEKGTAFVFILNDT